VPADIRLQTLITVKDRKISLDTVINLLETRQEYQNIMLKSTEIRKRVDQMTEGFLLEAKTVGLENRSPEFGALMKEYTDGIILYKAEQMEVWNKTSISDSALKNYYIQHREMFKFPDRVNISVLILDTDTLAYMVYDSLKKGADFEEFLDQYKEIPPPKSKDGARGLQPVMTDELTKHAASLSEGIIAEPVRMEDGAYAIVKLIAKEPERLKTFEEAGAEVSNVYQDYTSKLHEQQWLERIKQNHPVKQYKETLTKAFTSDPRHR